MDDPRTLYLDLLMRSLCGAVYDEVPVPIDVFWARRGVVKRSLARVASRVSGAFGGTVALRSAYSRQQLENGEVWPVMSVTMIGLKRMQNLRDCLTTVLKEQVPGDFIETGVWRGGACIFARGILKAYGDTERRVFVADSFQGLPTPNAEEYPEDAGDKHHRHDYLRVSQQQVEENFRRFGLLDDQVVFLKGWFKDTLPGLPSSTLSVIRLDGDMYESTMDGFRNLYHKLSPGGFCIIDDYMLPNCRQAVHDFRDEQEITEEMIPIDNCAVYWRKRCTGEGRSPEGLSTVSGGNTGEAQ